MAWVPKEHHSLFDTSPLSGVFFRDGDLLAKKLKVDWTKGEKSPMIAFPSGLTFPLWESSTPEGTIVHLFGELDLLLHDTCANAYQHVVGLAEQLGYLVEKVGTARLDVWGDDRTDHVLITYDDAARLMVNVEFIPLRPTDVRPHQPLLDEASRKRLPPLYRGEERGLNAVAQVKFFSPDSNWTWYASEFDGEDVFFGLVNGYALEFGYFSLSELEQTRGRMGLPIERDRYYEPKTLGELEAMHQQERSGHS